jgi:hypothetical protein
LTWVGRQCQLFAERESSTADENRWSRIAVASISRLAFRDTLREELQLACSESRASRYCLVIPEQPDVLDLEIAVCEGPDYRAVFPCAVGDSLVLVYGNSAMRGSAGHNAGQVRALLNSGITPLRATLGPLLQEGTVKESSWKINTTWLLSLAVLVVACVLSLAVAVALKRMPTEQ